MTLQEIKDAVKAGKEVYWSNRGPIAFGRCAYMVRLHHFRNGEEQWLITFTPNDHSIGLTHADGVTVNGKPEEFFIQ